MCFKFKKKKKNKTKQNKKKKKEVCMAKNIKGSEHWIYSEKKTHMAKELRVLRQINVTAVW